MGSSIQQRHIQPGWSLFGGDSWISNSKLTRQPRPPCQTSVRYCCRATFAAQRHGPHSVDRHSLGIGSRLQIIYILCTQSHIYITRIMNHDTQLWRLGIANHFSSFCPPCNPSCMSDFLGYNGFVENELPKHWA